MFSLHAARSCVPLTRRRPGAEPGLFGSVRLNGSRRSADRKAKLFGHIVTGNQHACVPSKVEPFVDGLQTNVQPTKWTGPPVLTGSHKKISKEGSHPLIAGLSYPESLIDVGSRLVGFVMSQCDYFDQEASLETPTPTSMTAGWLHLSVAVGNMCVSPSSGSLLTKGMEMPAPPFVLSLRIFG